MRNPGLQSGFTAEKSEPIGAVGDPPGGHARGNRRQKRPPEGKGEIGDQAKRGESEPENFALHKASLPKKLPWNRLQRILCFGEKRRKKKRPGAGPALPKRLPQELVNRSWRGRSFLLRRCLRNDRRSDALFFKSVLQHIVKRVNVSDLQVA